jgi:V-type H+-transporting ATPase subunit C
LSKKIEKEYNEKIRRRMPGVIVPGSEHALGVEDNDGNQVYRYVVYRE